MTEQEQFYNERDSRTRRYHRGSDRLADPIHVAIDETSARSAVGQVLLLALANQLSRSHRSISFAIPDGGAQKVVASVPHAQPLLGESILSLTQAIDPFGRFSLGKGDHAPLTIGIGMAQNTCDIYLGATRAIGRLSKEPTVLDVASPITALGAAVASCLGSAACFRAVHGLDNASEVSLSAWDLAQDGAQGPESISALDVGSVLMVGAGAVASSLAYWLNIFGVAGSWTIIDQDTIKLHNTNRSMLFLPSDAGWPNSTGTSKADLLARYLPNATSDSVWFDKSARADDDYDVVLCLANERDVRNILAARHAPVLLHATTGEQWVSLAHRHVSGVDDCIQCRMREARAPSGFECSTARVDSALDDSPDAALAFLSAASGLMLAVLLFRLQQGQLLNSPHNTWIWNFESRGNQFTQKAQQSCIEGCPHAALDQDVRRTIAQRSRWRGLVA